MNYDRINWVNDAPPRINADNLNHMDAGIKAAHDLLADSGTSGPGGVTDHGLLTGLSDDDHPQYLTEQRGDARYDPLGTAVGLVGALDIPTTPQDIGAQPAGDYAAGTHDHDGVYVKLADLSPAATPSHQTVLVDGDMTLPIDRTVLTLRASAPAVLTVPDAPDGSVITVHVAEGWENITWPAGVIVTGDSPTTETWVVLVRKEGAWHALVSGSGSGGMTGHGRPDHVGELGLFAPIGTVYTDLDATDGAVQWIVVSHSEEYDPSTSAWVDTATWEVLAGEQWVENPFTPAGYLRSYCTESHQPGSTSIRLLLRPSGMGQGVEVVVPAVTIALPNLPYFYGEPLVHIGGLLADNLVTRPVLNPGEGELSLSEFTVGAFTEEDPWMQGSITITITGPRWMWPVDDSGVGGGI